MPEIIVIPAEKLEKLGFVRDEPNCWIKQAGRYTCSINFDVSGSSWSIDDAAYLEISKGECSNSFHSVSLAAQALDLLVEDQESE